MAAQQTQEDTQKDANLDTTPEGWQRRWTVEINAAKHKLEKFYAQGEDALKAYRDERDVYSDACEETHWCLYTSTTQMKEDMLFGNTPRVEVTRRHADAADDVARVAAEMMERLLNSDIEKDGSTFASAISNALKDRLVPALGQARVHYEAEVEEAEETESAEMAVAVGGVEVEVEVETPAMVDEAGNQMAPPVPRVPRKTYECADTLYIHWKDYLWNADARVHSELRWLAFRNEMGRQALIKRFGDALGRQVPLNAKRHTSTEDGRKESPWGRAEVWEIWDRETKQVFWYVEGMHTVLEVKPDFLHLESFFPCPLPLLGLTTTSSLIPRNDYMLAKDLYRQINDYSTRISLLSDALRVAGVYDKSAGVDLSQLLDGSKRNILVPVDRYAAFAEKGGLRGALDFLPIEAVVAAIGQLSALRQADIDALYQITGMSDILRGQQTVNGTPGEAAIKARFASVRMQRLQDDVARFATDLQRLKAEVIAKHFSPESIIAQSNIMATPDAPLAQQAVALLQSDFARFRVEVKPESMALTDFAQLRQERTEMLGAIAQFFTAAAPLAQQMPNATPFLLRMLQWFTSGLRGASQIEGVLDEAITAAQQAAQQPQPAAPPDPRMQAQLLKGQQEMAKIQAETQARQQELAAETQAYAAKESIQREENVREAAQKQAISAAFRPPGGTGGVA